MKKIMFNDKYGLTAAVLEGRKTQTRRIVPKNIVEEFEQMFDPTIVDAARYKYGEIVAVAQSICDLYAEFDLVYRGKDTKSLMKKFGESPSFRNKMFVKAKEMPHQIRITDISVERLQDISDDDCLREGIRYIKDINKYYFERTDRYEGFYFENPRSAFASLIDKVSGRGTWDENPYVFVYQFELIK